MSGNLFSKRPCRNPEIIWKREGDKIFLFDPETGDILTLNATGARVWELSDGENTVDMIVDVLCKEFRNATKERVKTGLTKFINELTERKLITWK